MVYSRIIFTPGSNLPRLFSGLGKFTPRIKKNLILVVSDFYSAGIIQFSDIGLRQVMAITRLEVIATSAVNR